MGVRVQGRRDETASNHGRACRGAPAIRSDVPVLHRRDARSDTRIADRGGRGRHADLRLVPTGSSGPSWPAREARSRCLLRTTRRPLPGSFPSAPPRGQRSCTGGPAVRLAEASVRNDRRVRACGELKLERALVGSRDCNCAAEIPGSRSASSAASFGARGLKLRHRLRRKRHRAAESAGTFEERCQGER